MGRFYFDLFNDTTVLDAEGTDCSDLGAARAHAEESVRELAAESVKTLSHLVLHHHIAIRQDGSDHVEIVTFGDIVRVEP